MYSKKLSRRSRQQYQVVWLVKLIKASTFTKIETALTFIEIPGPTRKAPPPKHGGSEVNDIANKNSKNQQSIGKDSQYPATKNNYQSPDYEENYSSSEDNGIESGNYLQVKLFLIV